MNLYDSDRIQAAGSRMAGRAPDFDRCYWVRGVERSSEETEEVTHTNPGVEQVLLLTF